MKINNEKRIQVTLTPSESKKLIAKGIRELPIIKKALKEGTIIAAKSTTNAYVVNELVSEKLDVSRYSSGIITSNGTCLTNPKKALKETVLIKGKLSKIVRTADKRPSDIFLELLEKMNENDVFIKSANALDPECHAGILAGAIKGGIIGRILPIIKRRKVNLVIPVGLEKLIPTHIMEASKEAGIFKVNSSTGMPCDLVPVNGIIVTEIEAIHILSEAIAVPIAAGGISGAEGSVTMIIKGSEKQIQIIKKILLEVKGEAKINVPLADCSDCPTHKKLPWIAKPCPGFWK